MYINYQIFFQRSRMNPATILEDLVYHPTFFLDFFKMVFSESPPKNGKKGVIREPLSSSVEAIPSWGKWVIAFFHPEMVFFLEGKSPKISGKCRLVKYYTGIIIWPDNMMVCRPARIPPERGSGTLTVHTKSSCSFMQRQYIWANYNDVSRRHPKWWFNKGTSPKSP